MFLGINGYPLLLSTWQKPAEKPIYWIGGIQWIYINTHLKGKKMKSINVLNICAVIAVGLYGLTIYWDYGVTSDKVESNRVQVNRVPVNRFPVNRVPVNRFPANVLCESPTGKAQDEVGNLQDCIPSKQIVMSDRFPVNRVPANVLCESPAGKAQDDARNLQNCIPSKHIRHNWVYALLQLTLPVCHPNLSFQSRSWCEIMSSD